jgi:hypothetical protein
MHECLSIAWSSERSSPQRRPQPLWSHSLILAANGSGYQVRSLERVEASHSIFILSCKVNSFQQPALSHLSLKMPKEGLLGIGEQNMSGPVLVNYACLSFTVSIGKARNCHTMSTSFYHVPLYLQMGNCVPATTEDSSQRQKPRPSSIASSSFLVSSVSFCCRIV